MSNAVKWWIYVVTYQLDNVDPPEEYVIEIRHFQIPTIDEMKGEISTQRPQQSLYLHRFKFISYYKKDITDEKAPILF